MSYLNWKQATLDPVCSNHARLQNELGLILSQADLVSLTEALEEVYVSGVESEMRLDLPKQWLLLWKVREDGSRGLLAHPSELEWVGTFALDRVTGMAFVLSLKNLKQGQSLRLTELSAGVWNTVTNLELVVTLEGSG